MIAYSYRRGACGGEDSRARGIRWWSDVCTGESEPSLPWRCSVEHLPRYLAEFDYRYTTCKMDDTARMEQLMGQVGGRRHTYRRVVGWMRQGIAGRDSSG